MCIGQIRKSAQRGKNPPPGNQQELPFRMSQIPVPTAKWQPPPTCSAFSLLAWWSVAAPQEGHQERGSHTGLASAVPGCIPEVRLEGYLGMQRSQQVFRDLPSDAAERQIFLRTLPRPSSLLSYREPGVSRNSALFTLLYVLMDQPPTQGLLIYPASRIC